MYLVPVDKASTGGHRPRRWRQLPQRHRRPPVRLLYTTQHLLSMLSHPPHRSITRKQSTPQATHSQATIATHCWTQRRQPSSGWHQAAGHRLPETRQLAASRSRKWWCTVMWAGSNNL